jgi:DNA-binding SARP family transcriptional activator
VSKRIGSRGGGTERAVGRSRDGSETERRGGTDQFRVGLLGGFRLFSGDTVLPLPNGAKRLVAYLSLTGPRARADVAGTLWPEVRDEQALACLRSTLWRLGRLAPGAVVVRGPALAIGREVDVDVGLVRATARLSIGTDDAAVDRIDVSQLLDMARAELLPGWDDEWVVIEREYLRQTGLHALEALALKLSARGYHAAALQAALGAIAAEPLRESAYREAARVHLAEGNLMEAQRQFEACRRILQRELEVGPSPEFAELVRLPPATPSDGARCQRLQHRGLGVTGS